MLDYPGVPAPSAPDASPTLSAHLALRLLCHQGLRHAEEAWRISQNVWGSTGFRRGHVPS
jgi:hypothetical protein